MVLPLPLGALLSLLLSFSRPAAAATYSYGEFVLASRRGQFMGYRTPWMELLGRHCPMFARDRLVVVPIPQPSGFDKVNEYKLNLDFDGGRFITPWITIIGQGSPQVPVLRVIFRYTGDEIRQVRTEVVEASSYMIEQYPHLKSEFSRADHWPKHLLVSYQWEDTREFDVDTGLYLVFGLGLIVTMAVCSRVLFQYRLKLLEFFDSVAPDQETSADTAPYPGSQAPSRQASLPPQMAMPPLIPVPGVLGSGWGQLATGKRD